MQNFVDKHLIVDCMISIRDAYAEHEYRYKMPIHLIWGECDQLIPPDRGQLFFEHVTGNGANATLDIIKGGGHMPNMNKAKDFNRLLKKYLEI